MKKTTFTNQIKKFQENFYTLSQSSTQYESIRKELKQTTINQIPPLFSSLINPLLTESPIYEANFNELKVFVNDSDSKNEDQKLLLFKIAFKKSLNSHLDGEFKIESLIFIPSLIKICKTPLDFQRLIGLGKIAKKFQKNETILLNRLNLHFKKAHKTLITKAINPFKQLEVQQINASKKFHKLVYNELRSILISTPYVFNSMGKQKLHSHRFQLSPKVRFDDITQVKIHSIKEGIVKWELTNLLNSNNPTTYKIDLPNDNHFIESKLTKWEIEEVIQFIKNNLK